MTRRALLLTAVSVVIAVAMAAVVVWAGRDDPTRLRVNVAGIPDRVEARVEIAGPITYTVRDHRDERDVPAGRYTLRIRPVNTEAGKAFPEFDETSIEVRPHRTNTTAAEYVVIIPDTTKVLDRRRPGITNVDGRRVTFAAESPAVRVLKRGNIFIVAEGPQTSQLLVRRIDAITRDRTGVVVDTTPVSFSDALPSGRFRLDSERIGIRPASADPGGFVIRPAYEAPPTLSINFLELMLKREDGGCRSSARNAGFGMDVGNLKPRVGGKIDWGLYPPHAAVDITATLNPRVKLHLKLSGGASCEFKLDKEGGMAWLNTFCGKVIGTLVRIGPVSLRCEVEPQVKVGLKADAALTYTFGMTVSGGIEHSLPKFAISDPRMEDMHQSVLKGVKPSVRTGAELGLTIGLYGGDPLGAAKVGVKLGLGVGPELAVKPKDNTIEANLKFSFSIKPTISLDLPFKGWEKEFKAIEFVKTWRIWEASGKKYQEPAPPPPCPTDDDLKSALDIYDGHKVHDKVCAANYVAARWVDFHGVVGPVVLKHVGGGFSEFAGSYADESGPQCDADDIRRAPEKIKRYVGCEYWRGTPPSGSAPAEVAERQRRLFAALRDGDRDTACRLAGQFGVTPGSVAPTCGQALAGLKRAMRTFSTATPEPKLIQAVPGDWGSALVYLPTADDAMGALIWENVPDSGWQLRSATTLYG
ncbi:MAG: hypothetical protein ACRDTU_06890 [Micromonosporaceae bacterium]